MPLSRVLGFRIVVAGREEFESFSFIHSNSLAVTPGLGPATGSK